MIFAHPYWLVLLVILPILGWLRGKRGQPAALLYSSAQLVRNFSGIHESRAGRMLLALRWLTLAFLIIALARPQLTENETKVTASGVDIAVAIDLSSSMASEDPGFKIKGAQVNRLEIAKDVLKRFIERRPNDRIGVVAFAGRAYIAGPLTLDHDFLSQNIDRLELHVIEDGTAIGAGLTTAINRLRDLKSKSKIVILMTDGQNNMGKVPPLTAAEVAQALKIKVYTIGVGTHGMAPLPHVDQFTGRTIRTPVEVDIDEPTLKAIAAKTGGKYYRADSTDTLRRIYDEIDQLEKTEVEVKKYVHVTELFHWAVFPGCFFFLLELLLGNTIWRKLP
jgi:Ca-activated chloride channel family protein